MTPNRPGGFLGDHSLGSFRLLVFSTPNLNEGVLLASLSTPLRKRKAPQYQGDLKSANLVWTAKKSIPLQTAPQKVVPPPRDATHFSCDCWVLLGPELKPGSTLCLLLLQEGLGCGSVFGGRFLGCLGCFLGSLGVPIFVRF